MSEGRSDLPPRRAWAPERPDQLVRPGHTAGDFLEAHAWKIVAEDRGFLRISAHLPDHVRNPRGQLFGGFTPTYVDLVALFTVRAGPERLGKMGAPAEWLATTNMRVDYFDPITGPEFVIESRLVRERGRTCFVETRFLEGEPEPKLCVFALTTMRRVPSPSPLGDA